MTEAEGFPQPDDVEGWRHRLYALPACVVDNLRVHAPEPCHDCLARGVRAAGAVIGAESLMMRDEHVTRIEIIGPDGREFTRHCTIVDLDYQDDYRTLKIFVSGEDVIA